MQHMQFIANAESDRKLFGGPFEMHNEIYYPFIVHHSGCNIFICTVLDAMIWQTL